MTLSPAPCFVWSSEWIAFPSVTSTVAYRIGLGQGLAAKIPTVLGIYFRYDTALSDTNWQYCVDNAGTETCGATATAPAASTFQDFFISSSVVGTVSFQIGAGTVYTICASGCTTTGTVPTSTLTPIAGVVTLTSSTATIDVDAFFYQATGISR